MADDRNGHAAERSQPASSDPARKSRDTPFERLAQVAARWSSSSMGFTTALIVVLVWLVTGPIWHYSDTWQLVINTGTTIVTFLMVFLIQATQNRDAEAIQIKLDEIIRALDTAHNALLDLEELEEEDLQRMHRNYLSLAEKARKALEKGGNDTGVGELGE
jgi:low affinity Fe/Cu permease